MKLIITKSYKLACLVTLLAAINGCSSVGKEDVLTPKKDFFDGRILYIDEEKTHDNDSSPFANAHYTSGVEEFMTLSQVTADGTEALIKPVSYNISMETDKTNVGSPLYSTFGIFKVLTNKEYKGGDSWSAEVGAEYNASIEHWLLQDAIRRVSQKKGGAAVWRPELIGGQARKPDGKTPQALKTMNPGYVPLIEYVISEGFSVDEAEDLALTCYGNGFLDFKFRSKLSKEERDFWMVKARPYRDHYYSYGNNDKARCDRQREAMQKDGTSIFLGAPKMLTREQKAQVINTVRIADPELDVELWHHLLTTDLYKNHAKVQLEGPFSGLLFPERANVNIGFQTVKGMKATLYNDPLDNFSDDRLAKSHIAYQWFGDDGFKREFNDTSLLIAWDERKEHTRRMGGSIFSGSLKCGNMDNMANVMVSSNYFNKYYSCYMNLGNNRNAQALGYITSFGPKRSVGDSLSSGRPSGFIKFDNNVTASEVNAKVDCSAAAYKPACEASAPKHIDAVIEDNFIQQMTPYTAFAYTRITESGRVEGVAYYWGNKFIYDLTDIASWYKDRMQGQLRFADPTLSPFDLVEKARMMTGMNLTAQ